MRTRLDSSAADRSSDKQLDEIQTAGKAGSDPGGLQLSGIFKNCAAFQGAVNEEEGKNESGKADGG